MKHGTCGRCGDTAETMVLESPRWADPERLCRPCYDALEEWLADDGGRTEAGDAE